MSTGGAPVAPLPILAPDHAASREGLHETKRARIACPLELSAYHLVAIPSVISISIAGWFSGSRIENQATAVARLLEVEHLRD